MLLGDLVSAAGPRLDDLVPTPSAAVALLVSTSSSAACPRCGAPSDSVHSRYRRTVADLPCQDRPVALRLLLRRFRRVDPGCPRVIFCERLPGLLEAHARSTARLTQAHRAIGFALGGEAGARPAEHLDMPTSPDTLLRRIKGAADEPAPSPRLVGVDDWAVRKGRRHGTIPFDLERGHVIDIPPGRDGEVLKVWPKGRPGVEVVTRDRWAAYAQAASEGAPQARQVADRWHLLKNLREAIERLLERHAASVRAALQEAPAVPAPAAVGDGPSEPAPSPLPAERPVLPSRASTPKQQTRQARHRERVRQYERVKELRAQGQSLRQIARATGLPTKRVIRYLRSHRRPDWKTGREAPTQLDRFAEHIAAWIEGGGRNAAALYREIVGQGYRGSYDAVRRYLARRLGGTGRPGPRVGALTPPAAPAPPSARKLSFELIRRPEEREAEEQARLDKLRGGEPALQEGLDLAGEFAEMVRRRGGMSLAVWLAKVEGSGRAELRSFASGLRPDEAAVAAALSERRSNGPVEGAVNRLKLIKRSMYGRAGWELLRARVRHAG